MNSCYQSKAFLLALCASVSGVFAACVAEAQEAPAKASYGPRLSPFPEQAPFKAEFKDFIEFRDQARDSRDVPMRIYYPTGRDARGPFPVIVFSHGLGGSMRGYGYLGAYWAEHGFIAAHVQHIGSDEAIFKNGVVLGLAQMKSAIQDPDNIVNRPKDISFAIDTLAELNASDPVLKGMLDMKAVGVAGHSFGAYTTLAVSGQLVGGSKSFRDDRVLAAIEMSAPGMTVDPANLDKAYSAISIPMMHFTGTADKMLGGNDPADRLLPYKKINAPNQYLIVFDGGEHMLFSGRTRFNREETKLEAIRHGLIEKATAAFFLAYLKGDKRAMNYINDPMGLKNDLSANASFEHK